MRGLQWHPLSLTSSCGDLQGRAGWGWLTNEVVNFINTLVGALVAIAAVSLTGMGM